MKNTGPIHKSCAEARHAAFQAANPGRVYKVGECVKLKVSEGDVVEHCWFLIIRRRLKAGTYIGVLSNDVLRLKRHSEGDLAEFSGDEVEEVWESKKN